MAARKALIGTATPALGPRARNAAQARLLTRSMRSAWCRNLSVEVVGQGWSGWLVHLFLEDRELARVAVSCRLALDF